MSVGRWPVTGRIYLFGGAATGCVPFGPMVFTGDEKNDEAHDDGDRNHAGQLDPGRHALAALRCGASIGMWSVMLHSPKFFDTECRCQDL